MKKHETLKADAILAIHQVHGDLSVDAQTTLDSLNEIQGELQSLIDSVQDDLSRVNRKS